MLERQSCLLLAGVYQSFHKLGIVDSGVSLDIKGNHADLTIESRQQMTQCDTSYSLLGSRHQPIMQYTQVYNQITVPLELHPALFT